MTTVSTESKIREIAYGLWEQEGRPQGRELDHYFKAEQLVKKPAARTSASTSTKASATGNGKTVRARKTAAKSNGTNRKSAAKKSSAKS